MYLLDGQGDPLYGYPVSNFDRSALTAEENAGIELALSGLPYQSYTIQPISGGAAAWVSNLALVEDSVGMPHGILIGRSDLAANPFTRPALASLDNLTSINGEGMLLDEDGRILYHSSGMRIMQYYLGKTTVEADFYDDTGADGTRRLVYYQPVPGMTWRVLLSVPAQQAQQIALNIAIPLLSMLLLAFALAAVLLRLSLRLVTGSVQGLAKQAERIARGDLDHPLVVVGEDEVGKLGAAFEQMRSSLKARLDELSHLLLVSQGVASSLEIGQAVQPVLESALGTGATSARIVLAPEAMPETDGSSMPATRFWLGPSSEVYAALDEQVLGLARRQPRVMLTNFTRTRVLNFPADVPHPSAILALPLRHENLYYGALWMAYDKVRPFSEDELRYLATLAGQAALAAANARLFSNAEIGRQRLEAILEFDARPGAGDGSPEPHPAHQPGRLAGDGLAGGRR